MSVVIFGFWLSGDICYFNFAVARGLLFVVVCMLCLCGLSLFGCCCNVLWFAMLLWVRLRRVSIGLILG